MKTLILTEEAFGALLALDGANGIFKPDAPLPRAEELHRIARAKTETPDVFLAQRQRIEAADDAAEEMRAQMHDLIVRAHRRGVGATALARWSDYSIARIYQILDNYH